MMIYTVCSFDTLYCTVMFYFTCSVYRLYIYQLYSAPPPPSSSDGTKGGSRHCALTSQGGLSTASDGASSIAGTCTCMFSAVVCYIFYTLYVLKDKHLRF